MAKSRIAGITIEIDGDATGLKNALSGVESTIKQTHSSLNDVNRLLKLNPTSTELLTQKQTYLNTELDATKQKLQTEQQALDQLNARAAAGEDVAEQQRAMQREVEATTQRYKGLTKEVQDFGDVTSQQMQAAGTKMMQTGQSISNVGTSLTRNVTMPVVALGTAIVKTSADFDSEMSRVSAISGATGDELDALRDKAREMGSKTKFSATEAAEGFEYMAMAGWKTEDMLSGIEGVMNLAAASGENLGTTSDIVTDALTAFGLTAQDSGHFADVLAAASSNANTNVSMMGETFKYAAPIAGALGFSIEDTAEAIGLMANAGIKGSQAGTSLRTILTALSGEVKICGEAIGEVEIQTTNADGSMRDLGDILTDLRAAFSQLSESEQASAASALVGKNAMSGFLALMNAGESDINKLSSAIENCDGEAKRMADTMNDNLEGQLKILMSALQELALSLGEILIPILREVVEAIQGVVDWLNSLDPAVKEIIVKTALVAAAIGPVLVAIGNLITSIGAIVKAAGVLRAFFAGGKALTMATSLISGVSTAISAVGTLITGTIVPALSTAIAALAPFAPEILFAVAAIGAVIAIMNNWGGITDWLIEKWEQLKEWVGNAVTSIGEAVGAVWDTISTTISEAFNSLVEMLTPIFEAIGNTVSTLWTAICDTVISIWNGMVETFSPLIEAFRYLFETIFQAIQILIGRAMDAVSEKIQEIWNGIVEFITPLLESLQQFFDTIWTAICTFVDQTNQQISQIINTIWTAISEFINQILNAISSTVQSIWNSISSFIDSTMNTISTTVQSIWNNIHSAISSIINNIYNTIREGFEQAVSYVKGLASQAYQWGADIINGIINGIKSCISSLASTVTDVANTIKESLHFSVPDKGPLRDFNSWMPDMMHQLAQGIEDGRSLVQNAIGRVAEDLNISGAISEAGQIPGLAGAAGGFFGDIIIPVNIGQERIDTIVVKATDRVNYRSGGR